jgi:glycosyltransferase involved in cell wall biosynthesis
MSVKVSVLTTTYNHEPFIGENIESVLAQQTSFAFEQVIGEDGSTDRTPAIVEDYWRRRPDVIRPILRPRNAGRRQNFFECFRACQGDYIAILEGDDYWTAPHKLQVQADLLDANPGIAICFHAFEQCFEDGAPPRVSRRRRARYTLDDLLESNFVPTCTVMFRNRLFDEFPPWFAAMPAGDWPLHVLNAQHGDIAYIDEVMAMHRTHSGGVWSPRPVSERRQSMLTILQAFRDNLDPRYRPTLERSMARWELKLLNALLLERRYRAAGDRLLQWIAHPSTPRLELLKAAAWALRQRNGEPAA